LSPTIVGGRLSARFKSSSVGRRLPPQGRRLAWVVFLCCLVGGCGPAKRMIVGPPPSTMDTGWTERSISTDEMRELTERDPELSTDAVIGVLARLNHKDRSYIKQDLKNGKALKVPNDFHAYLSWTPLPSRIRGITDTRECILVVKDLAFLGWYENGKLVCDTNVCIGKKKGWTKAGLYDVLDKDISHVSGSYRSAYGYPALMPYALRIYGRVWIHGGDVTGGYCSHGCINLPLDAAEKLYQWANPGATVLIVESLSDLDRTLDKYSRQLTAGRRML
jgi:hypothetical protein